MSLYRMGSMGEEVGSIQEELRRLGLYRGPLDSVFGGGTQSAVRTFQRLKGITEDGIVGCETWKLLFPQQNDIPPPQVCAKTIDHRCLALTGSFETTLPVPDCFSGLSGDFDGQGVSFGALQWNFGQGSLQPMLHEMVEHHTQVLRDIFGDHFSELHAVLQAGLEDQLDWVRSLQDHRFRFAEPWHGMFKTLGRQKEFQEIQLNHAKNIYNTALRWCADYGLQSERAVALMYDIRVQNGSINDTVKSRILRDFDRLPRDNEAERLAVIANRRAEAANRRWIEDVRARKLAIAKGEGCVHGRYYDLETQYGIRLSSFAP